MGSLVISEISGRKWLDVAARRAPITKDDWQQQKSPKIWVLSNFSCIQGFS